MNIHCYLGFFLGIICAVSDMVYIPRALKLQVNIPTLGAGYIAVLSCGSEDVAM